MLESIQLLDAVDPALLAVQQAALALPDAVDRFVKREVVGYVRAEVTKQLKREPGPVVYPIEWASPKQRRWFWWAVGEGLIDVPYQRTQHYIRGWHVRGDYRQGLGGITVTNDWDYAEFVGGARQQPFHKNTGWAQYNQVLQVIAIEASDRLADGLPSVIEQAGGAV